MSAEVRLDVDGVGYAASVLEGGVGGGAEGVREMLPYNTRADGRGPPSIT